jgi:phosphatidylglycerol:prolipoprotein diacylglycerol transferase
MFAFLLHPNIDPTLLQIWGPLAIRWYSLMYIVGFLFAYSYFYFWIKKDKIKMTLDDLGDIIFAGFLGVLLGGRLGYVLFYDLANNIRNPLHIFFVWQGGMSFHGGLLGVMISFWVYSLIKKKNVFDLMDLAAIPTAVALGLGRWGNFVNQELWGRPTDAPWGVIFPSIPKSKLFPASEPWVREMANRTGLYISPSEPLVNLPRHPSQIYEMLLEGLVLFLVLYGMSKIRKFSRGILASTFLVGYGISRFIVEFFREPDAHIGYLIGNWFTEGMLLSLPMVLVGFIGLLYFSKKKQRNELWA